MPVKNIVRGQRVSTKQLEGAKELRREMTPEEKILWKQLRTNKLNGLHFRRHTAPADVAGGKSFMVILLIFIAMSMN
jgi:very-short-patch-repair endonuclease